MIKSYRGSGVIEPINNTQHNKPNNQHTTIKHNPIKEVKMNRYEIIDLKDSRDDLIIDNVTGKRFQVEQWQSDDICTELNKLSDRADKVIEAYTTPELLKLKWQKDIYKRFSKETLRILNKHNIHSLEELDTKLTWRTL